MEPAAVVHDCLRKALPDLNIETVDLVFREALRACGVSKLWSEVAYQAVRFNNNRA